MGFFCVFVLGDSGWLFGGYCMFMENSSNRWFDHGRGAIVDFWVKLVLLVEKYTFWASFETIV